MKEIENPFNLNYQIKTHKDASADNLQANDTNGHNDKQSNYYTDSEDSDSSDGFDSNSKHDSSFSDTSSASSIKLINKCNNGTNESIKTSNSVNQFFNIPNKMKIPIVTNTTLNVIRLFGKYLHMLDTFEIISTHVINYMMQLFNFYFYYIYFNFAKREVNELLLYALNLN